MRFHRFSVANLWRRKKLCATLVLVATISGLGVAKLVLDARYFDGYDSTAPLSASVLSSKSAGRYIRHTLIFSGWRNESVPTLLLVPSGLAEQAAPCVVVVHGLGQDKGIIESAGTGSIIAQPFLDAGFAVACFDQPECGDRKRTGESPLRQAQSFRLRAAHTVNDSRELVDYLQSRPDISPNQIYLVGISYGAMTGAVAAAFDGRFRAVVLCYGGAGYGSLVTSPVLRNDLTDSMLPTPVIQLLLWYFLSVSDPAAFVDRIAPRPVLLQNGTDDSVLGMEAALRLYNAASEPKTLKWYRGDHIGMNGRVINEVVADMVSFLVTEDVKL